MRWFWWILGFVAAPVDETDFDRLGSGSGDDPVEIFVGLVDDLVLGPCWDEGKVALFDDMSFGLFVFFIFVVLGSGE